MSDGVACPDLHDGMAGVDEWNGREQGDDKGDNRRFAQNNIVLTKDYNTRACGRLPARTSGRAGACYSPDGQWLLVNIQTPGVTFAITGPW